MIITDKDKAILLTYIDTHEKDEKGRNDAIEEFLKHPNYSKYSRAYLKEVLNNTIGSNISIEEGQNKLNLSKTIKEGENFERYCKFLKEKRKFSASDISKIKIDVKRIMQNINTVDDINFLIKGLVIGDIQSGKTANFAGLMSLAFDMDYHTIIVLSGTINDLRSQTSERLTNDLGIITDEIDEEYLEDLKWGNDIICQNTSGEFSKKEINQYRTNIGRKNFFVIKKNKTVLENLVNFFSKEITRSSHLATKKFLIIDDEVDQASQDGSRKGSGKPTVIYKLICELIATIKKVSYIGYTATPFAPVLADQNSTYQGINLFPSDFVYLLKSSEKYTGYYDFLSEESDLNSEIINYIGKDDEEKLIKISKNKEILNVEDFEIFSLFCAFKDFLISAALIEECNMKNIKKIELIQKSMLINISSTTAPQATISSIINKYVSKLKKWTRSEIYNEFINDYKFKYSNYSEMISFDNLVSRIIEIVKLIQVYEINTGNLGKKINLINLEIKEKMKVGNVYSIYIGGHKLSRGITIEGLLVSYFYRNSLYYDAAMQMCRWFGYRENYLEFTKIYSSEKIYENLINYFKAFELFKKIISQKLELGMTGNDIIYQISYHEKTKPTSSNKMKGAELRIPELQDRKQIYDYYVNEEINKFNFQLADSLLKKHKITFPCLKFNMYQNISFEEIKGFCMNLKLPYNSSKKMKGLIKEINKVKDGTFDDWIIVVANIVSQKNGQVDLGNATYNLSKKRYENIFIDDDTKEPYYKIKVVLNTPIEKFREVVYEDNQNIDLQFDRPVMFLFNTILSRPDSNINSIPLNLYAFRFPPLSDEFKEEFNLNFYWVNNSGTNDEDY
ncbi:putative endonuclease [Spiroplasma syrphidicola EA-1]|uniref:Putative endonuclease n=1 Tax=Spiroplasma syrphidicola EA-1 TaxID=1276229 RepID=R4U533_9MOLU|nr:endonuclease [Spiroplasma syrphidicola]AGM25648.1 putative endonuclease [Spiroplasma syrphidicola EA-1]